VARCVVVDVTSTLTLMLGYGKCQARMTATAL